MAEVYPKPTIENHHFNKIIIHKRNSSRVDESIKTQTPDHHTSILSSPSTEINKNHNKANNSNNNNNNANIIDELDEQSVSYLISTHSSDNGSKRLTQPATSDSFIIDSPSPHIKYPSTDTYEHNHHFTFDSDDSNNQQSYSMLSTTLTNHNNNNKQGSEPLQNQMSLYESLKLLIEGDDNLIFHSVYNNPKTCAFYFRFYQSNNNNNNNNDSIDDSNELLEQFSNNDNLKLNLNKILKGNFYCGIQGERNRKRALPIKAELLKAVFFGHETESFETGRSKGVAIRSCCFSLVYGQGETPLTLDLETHTPERRIQLCQAILTLMNAIKPKIKQTS